MPAAFILAFAQLADRRLLWVLLKALGLTLLLFAGAGWGIFTTVDSIDPSGWPRWLHALWTGGAGDAAAVVLAALLCWLSFTALATGVMALWLDEVIAAVEARYYPAAKGAGVGFGAELVMGFRSMLRVVLVNAALLPAYLLLLVTGFGPILLFVLVNGWLMGQDYLEMVAARHVALGEARAWPGTHRWDAWGIGIITAGLFAVPVFNLVAPIIGTAVATHIFHRRDEGAK